MSLHTHPFITKLVELAIFCRMLTSRTAAGGETITVCGQARPQATG
jgi:hypothetical protein